MSEIYDRIKARRIELGLTVEQLAALMGYKDKSSISKIENGKRLITDYELKYFTDVLKIPIYSLFEQNLGCCLTKEKFLLPEEKICCITDKTKEDRE